MMGAKFGNVPGNKGRPDLTDGDYLAKLKAGCVTKKQQDVAPPVETVAQQRNYGSKRRREATGGK